LTSINKTHSQCAAYASFSLSRSVLALRFALPICLGLALFFNVFPQVDLWASALFFKPTAAPASGFWLATSPVLIFIYEAVNVCSRIALIASILGFIGYMLMKNAKAFCVAIVMLSLVAGPTLAVNGGAKEHWGRARPRDVVQFAGKQQFTPAWIISNQCQHNCAFTSGHAAAGFALCIGFFVSRRKVWLNAGLLLGALIGLTRMMNGAHFLSDVVFSFFIVFITSAIMTWVLSTLTLKYCARLAASDMKH
jgi:lipid A 4'-phosphatase